MNPSSMYQGEINPGFMGDNLSLAGSRKSGGLQPVMLMPHGPQDDRSVTRRSKYSDLRINYFRYSEFSHPANRSSQSPMRSGPQVQHNFQL